jgi:hypothetical protein
VGAIFKIVEMNTNDRRERLYTIDNSKIDQVDLRRETNFRSHVKIKGRAVTKQSMAVYLDSYQSFFIIPFRFANLCIRLARDPQSLQVAAQIIFLFIF